MKWRVTVPEDYFKLNKMLFLFLLYIIAARATLLFVSASPHKPLRTHTNGAQCVALFH